MKANIHQHGKDGHMHILNGKICVKVETSFKAVVTRTHRMLKTSSDVATDGI